MCTQCLDFYMLRFFVLLLEKFVDEMDVSNLILLTSVFKFTYLR